MEESERRSRDLLGDKVESVLWVVDEVLDQRENPDTMKVNMEMDEVYVELPLW